MALADVLDSSEFDEVRVVRVESPELAEPGGTVAHLVAACEARGLRAFDLDVEAGGVAHRRRASQQSLVALVRAGDHAQWRRLILTALAAQRLSAIVVIGSTSEGRSSGGAGTPTTGSNYPDVEHEPVLAAEPTVPYGTARASPSAVTLRRGRARAAWHHRRGDRAAAVHRLCAAAEAALRGGHWGAAVRSARAAVETSAAGCADAATIRAATLCARVLLETGDARRATQLATVVMTASAPVPLSPTQVADAMLTLAEVAEFRGQWVAARGWLDRCASHPADDARRRAVAIRLALWSGDVLRAANLANQVSETIDRDGTASVETLVAAASVHARLGDVERAQRVLRRATDMATLSQSQAERACVVAAVRALAVRPREQLSKAVPARTASSSARTRLSTRARAVISRLRSLVGVTVEGRSSRRVGQPCEEGEPVVVNEVVSILRIAQGEGDEAEIVEKVCQFLRARWRSAGVGVWVSDHWQAPAVAVGRCEITEAFAHRVVSVDWMVGPVSACVANTALTAGTPAVSGSVLAGVAIRYAGRVVGVLAVRWSSEPIAPTGHLSAVLAAATVALGPAVAVVADRRQADPTPSPERGGGLIGVSEPMNELRMLVRRAAVSPFPVLILGESGSGKELVARAIHGGSSRRTRRFCAVNCAALTDELFDAELFGHAKGAFTGALQERRGLIEEADGGTLFLDEVGELSARGQAKLLRVLQERELRRIGENLPRRVDVRVIAATNRDLMAATRAGTFRLDLLYRLDVLRLVVPPLRARGHDVLLLAHEFWKHAAPRVDSRASLGAEVLSALARYHWPGNVRELQNVVTALAVGAPRRGRVEVRHLPPALVSDATNEPLLPLAEARRQFDRDYLCRALTRAGGSRSRAAQMLGITRQGLAKMLDRRGTGVSERTVVADSGEQ